MRVFGAILGAAIAMFVGFWEPVPAPPPPALAPDSSMLLAQHASARRLASLIVDGRVAITGMRQPGFWRLRRDLNRFYADGGYSLAWTAGGHPTRRALEVIRTLKDARSEGLDPGDYDAGMWDSLVAALDSPAPGTLEAFDLALTVSAMRYASDLHRGKANPGSYNIGGDGGHIPLPTLVRDDMLSAESLEAGLARIEPPQAEYRRTVDALQRYRRIAEDRYGAQPIAPPVEILEPGQPYDGVAGLAALLAATGDLPLEAVPNLDPAVYGPPLVEAVQRFQSRHGLEPDGRIGKSTLAALQTPLTQRVRQLELSLERWRWLPRDYARKPILVNLPEFELRAGDGASGFEARTVVGAARGHRTPGFAGEMTYLVFRPYWNVPLSIQKRELVPHIVEDPLYLAKNGYEVVTWQGEVVSNGAVSAEVLAQLKSGALGIRQLPGDGNSLGLVKFMFPNDNDIYLHDTPSKYLFERTRRDFSHGCIRVENAERLAQWVLADQPGWSLDRIRAAMHGEGSGEGSKDARVVRLATPIPVLLVYHTAVVREDGETDFFEDIYGYDRQLDRQLRAGPPDTDLALAASPAAEPGMTQMGL